MGICNRCLLLSEADELARLQLAACTVNERYELEQREDEVLQALRHELPCEVCFGETIVEGWQ